jgi:hypothetical protein
MIDAGSPIKEFIKQSIKQIEAGLPSDYQLSSPIAFDLSVANVDKINGGINLQVIKIGGDVSKEQVQRISFSVSSKTQEKENYKKAKRLFKDLSKLDSNNS